MNLQSSGSLDGSAFGGSVFGASLALSGSGVAGTMSQSGRPLSLLERTIDQAIINSKHSYNDVLVIPEGLDEPCGPTSLHDIIAQRISASGHRPQPTAPLARASQPNVLQFYTQPPRRSAVAPPVPTSLVQPPVPRAPRKAPKVDMSDLLDVDLRTQNPAYGKGKAKKPSKAVHPMIPEKLPQPPQQPPQPQLQPQAQPQPFPEKVIPVMPQPVPVVVPTTEVDEEKMLLQQQVKSLLQKQTELQAYIGRLENSLHQKRDQTGGLTETQRQDSSTYASPQHNSIRLNLIQIPDPIEAARFLDNLQMSRESVDSADAPSPVFVKQSPFRPMKSRNDSSRDLSSPFDCVEGAAMSSLLAFEKGSVREHTLNQSHPASEPDEFGTGSQYALPPPPSLPPPPLSSGLSPPQEQINFAPNSLQVVASSTEALPEKEPLPVPALMPHNAYQETTREESESISIPVVHAVSEPSPTRTYKGAQKSPVRVKPMSQTDAFLARYGLKAAPSISISDDTQYGDAWDTMDFTIEMTTDVETGKRDYRMISKHPKAVSPKPELMPSPASLMSMLPNSILSPEVARRDTAIHLNSQSIVMTPESVPAVSPESVPLTAIYTQKIPHPMTPTLSYEVIAARAAPMIPTTETHQSAPLAQRIPIEVSACESPIQYRGEADLVQRIQPNLESLEVVRSHHPSQNIEVTVPEPASIAIAPSQATSEEVHVTNAIETNKVISQSKQVDELRTTRYGVDMPAPVLQITSRGFVPVERQKIPFSPAAPPEQLVQKIFSHHQEEVVPSPQPMMVQAFRTTHSSVNTSLVPQEEPPRIVSSNRCSVSDVPVLETERESTSGTTSKSESTIEPEQGWSQMTAYPIVESEPSRVDEVNTGLEMHVLKREAEKAEKIEVTIPAEPPQLLTEREPTPLDTGKNQTNVEMAVDTDAPLQESAYESPTCSIITKVVLDEPSVPVETPKMEYIPPDPPSYIPPPTMSMSVSDCIYADGMSSCSSVSVTGMSAVDPTTSSPQKVEAVIPLPTPDPEVEMQQESTNVTLPESPTRPSIVRVSVESVQQLSARDSLEEPELGSSLKFETRPSVTQQFEEMPPLVSSLQVHRSLVENTSLQSESSLKLYYFSPHSSRKSSCEQLRGEPPPPINIVDENAKLPQDPPVEPQRHTLSALDTHSERLSASKNLIDTLKNDLSSEVSGMTTIVTPPQPELASDISSSAYATPTTANIYSLPAVPPTMPSAYFATPGSSLIGEQTRTASTITPLAIETPTLTNLPPRIMTASLAYGSPATIEDAENRKSDGPVQPSTPSIISHPCESFFSPPLDRTSPKLGMSGVMEPDRLNALVSPISSMLENRTSLTECLPLAERSDDHVHRDSIRTKNLIKTNIKECDEPPEETFPSIHPHPPLPIPVPTAPFSTPKVELLAPDEKEYVLEGEQRALHRALKKYVAPERTEYLAAHQSVIQALSSLENLLGINTISGNDPTTPLGDQVRAAVEHISSKLMNATGRRDVLRDSITDAHDLDEKVKADLGLIGIAAEFEASQRQLLELTSAYREFLREHDSLLRDALNRIPDTEPEELDPQEQTLLAQIPLLRDNWLSAMNDAAEFLRPISTPGSI
ncbi:hypothetical protein GMRT_15200 [Giardia muris]|uniref:Uncharacterized protein n=1 Tax=Giardia muris TaxID=5742 RepID=A0A4Z1SQM7_GIAMU|nr:hypothetical protein GMRT_15200 [Giardia muris]|eukprot:TNJ28136.1 hypothetical protein GMRT_15200 [Giardia muris]